jgi:hypothetical protein
VPSSRAGVFTVLLPVSAALVGVLVLGEGFGAAHIAAFVLAMVGLLLATWPERAAACRRSNWAPERQPHRGPRRFTIRRHKPATPRHKRTGGPR